jgi:hypothetical protein
VKQIFTLDVNELLTSSQMIIILYHEMMWDMLNILEQQNIITRPIAFKDPIKVQPKDISDLLIIIIKQ